jgi:Sec-independent protein secretion pathway component TatC
MTEHHQTDVRLDREWPPGVKAAVLVVAATSALVHVSGIWFTLPVSMASLVLAEIAAPELGRRTRAWLIALAILGLVLATGRILTTL